MRTFCRRYIVVVAVILLAVTFFVVYFRFDPSAGFFPRCPFFSVTGYLCPGCGSQRALHALLHGDLVAAWHYNAMMLLFIPVVSVLLVAEVCRKKSSCLYTRVNSRFVIWGVVAVIVAWWILRNIL